MCDEAAVIPATLFLDNGGHTVKAMYIAARRAGTPATSVKPRFLVLHNCVGSSPVAGDDVVGAHLRELPHYHGFTARRPVSGGFISDVALQARVWEYVLQHFHISPEEEPQTELWLTCPHGAPVEAARAMWELLTQHFHFPSVVLVSATFLTLVGAEGAAAACRPAGASRKRVRTGAGSPGADAVVPGSGIVLDMGHSATVVVPYVNYVPILTSHVRMNVGGKALADRLREHLSFAHTDVREDAWLVQHIMERCCYVRPPCSPPPPPGRQTRPRGRRYYLPAIPALYPLGCTEAEVDERLDGGGGSTRPAREGGRGETRRVSHGERLEAAVLPVLWLREECEYIPGLLLAPSAMGLLELGIVPSILHAVAVEGLLGSSPLLRHAVTSRVYVSGGTSQFPHMLERLRADLCAALSAAADGGAACEFHGSTVTLDDGTGRDQPCVPPPGADIPVIEGEGVGSVAASEAVLQPLRGAAWLLTSEAAAELRVRVERNTWRYLRGPQECTVSELHDAMRNIL